MVAGRGGYLGEGVQKFLGAAKKETNVVLSKLDNKADDVVSDLNEKGSEIVEPQTVVRGFDNKADDIADSVVGSSGARLASELPDHFNPDAINAKLDLTIPKITEPWHIDKVPDPFEGVDMSLIKSRKDNIIRVKLPNGHSRSLTFYDGQFFSSYEYDASGKNLHDWLPGSRFVIYKDGRDLYYDKDGKLVSIWENGRDGIYRLIFIKPLSGEVLSISQVRKVDSGLLCIKDDFSKNGVRTSEKFYDETGKNVIFSRNLA